MSQVASWSPEYGPSSNVATRSSTRSDRQWAPIERQGGARTCIAEGADMPEDIGRAWDRGIRIVQQLYCEVVSTRGTDRTQPAVRDDHTTDFKPGLGRQ